MQTIRLYTQDIGMEFGIEKCVMVIMKNGKREERKEYNYQIRKESECLGKGKFQVLRNTGTRHR